MKTVSLFVALVVLSACSPVLSGGERLRQEGLGYVNQFIKKCGEDYFAIIETGQFNPAARKLQVIQGKTSGVVVDTQYSYVPAKVETQADKLNGVTPGPELFKGTYTLTFDPGRIAVWTDGNTKSITRWVDDLRMPLDLWKDHGSWIMFFANRNEAASLLAVECDFVQSIFDKDSSIQQRP